MTAPVVLCAGLLLLLSVFSSSASTSSSVIAAPSDPAAAPETFQVRFTVSSSPPSTIVLNVTRSLAPIGVDHFYSLLNLLPPSDGEPLSFYDNNSFFRVVPDFVVQFGINGIPKMNAEFGQLTIPDDPVVGSNTYGTVSYATAGANTRTTQLFVNLADNSRLDASGFSPFAVVVEGMDFFVNAVFNPTPNDSNGVDQDKLAILGNEWVEKQYPGIEFIETARIVNANY